MPITSQVMTEYLDIPHKILRCSDSVCRPHPTAEVGLFWPFSLPANNISPLYNSCFICFHPSKPQTFPLLGNSPLITPKVKVNIRSPALHTVTSTSPSRHHQKTLLFVLSLECCLFLLECNLCRERTGAC